jgi:preprotein translocase subunit SecB
VAERALNLVAAAKIARRVNLIDVRVDEISAKRLDDPTTEMEAELTDSYAPKKTDSTLEILCNHHMKAVSAGDCVAEIQVSMRLVYGISGTEPVDDDDLPAFAAANGAYHSWPFVREMYYSLTSRLGLPPFVLEVMRLSQIQPAKEPPEGVESASASKSE